MGWSSGTDLFCRVAQSIKRNVKDTAARRRIYSTMLEAFTDADWDCMDEGMGIDPVWIS